MYRTLSWEPSPRLRDFGFRATWEDLDRQASAILGIPATAVPSVRVGMCWALEFLGLRRHADHVLVPPFLGRCILNSLNRFAMPVEEITSRTRLAVVVHQFGFQQRLAEIHARCHANGWRYLEDSPYGLAEQETLGVGSLAKFIGLSKILPVLKGAVMVTEEAHLATFSKAKRAETSAWSWPLWLMLVGLRYRRFVGSHSVLAELAYELYGASKGDHAWFRGNILRALQHVAYYEHLTAQRLELLQERLREHVLVPDATRLGYVVPFRANGHEPIVADILTRYRLDASRYHLDLNRNLFEPDYQPVFLIPLNPHIPQRVFEALVQELSRIEESVEPLAKMVNV